MKFSVLKCLRLIVTITMVMILIAAPAVKTPHLHLLLWHLNPHYQFLRTD